MSPSPPTASPIPLIRLRLKPTLRLTEGGYLFDGATAETYTLNPTGLYIVRGMMEGRDPVGLWSGLVAAFAVPETRARRDVRRFLADLRAARLLVEDQVGAL
jgi:hypothetical protein